MGDAKTLTVSVAAYNVEQYLEHAVKSCIAAGDKRVELIIVNDGSKDGTIEVARRLEADCPDCVRVIDKANGGYGSTINASLAVAKGKYFRYLDGDDWLLSRQVSSYLDLLDNACAGAVYAPYLRCYESDGREELIDPMNGLSGEITPDQIPNTTSLAGCSIAYRTELLRKRGFSMSEHRFYADIEFAYIPMAHVGTVLITHDPVYGYRIGREGQSVSIEGIVRHYDDMLAECSVLYEKLTLEGDINASDGAKEYIGRCITKETVTAVRYACMAKPSMALRQKLKTFDKMTRKCPDVYRASGERSKLLRMLRMSRFLLLPLAHHMTFKQAQNSA